MWNVVGRTGGRELLNLPAIIPEKVSVERAFGGYFEHLSSASKCIIENISMCNVMQFVPLPCSDRPVVIDGYCAGEAVERMFSIQKR